MRTPEAEMVPELEVTAVSPFSGRKKRLAPEELDNLFALLTDYEEALGQGAGPESAGRGRAESMRDFSDQFKVLGVDIGWFAEKPREDQPLFFAKVGPVEKAGYRLKDLLGIARETGILEAAPRAPRDLGFGPEETGAKRVCVVEDDESVREMFAFALRSDGFEVSPFADGIEFMKELQDGPADARLPDIILLDLMLPGQNGYEILRRLQMGKAKDIPVIIITGRLIDRGMSRVMLQETNLREFIQKPIQPADLLAAVHKALKTAAPVETAVS